MNQSKQTYLQLEAGGECQHYFAGPGLAGETRVAETKLENWVGVGVYLREEDWGQAGQKQ